MELSNQPPGSHPLTAPVHPPERVAGPLELHHSEGRNPAHPSQTVNDGIRDGTDGGSHCPKPSHSSRSGPLHTDTLSVSGSPTGFPRASVKSHQVPSPTAWSEFWLSAFSERGWCRRLMQDLPSGTVRSQAGGTAAHFVVLIQHQNSSETYS